MKSYFIFLLFAISACTALKKNNRKGCKMPKPQTIFYDFDSQSNDYDHYILLEGHHRECMDSVTMVNMAKKYAAKLKHGKPALLMRFYSSKDYFIPDEVSQPMHEINRNCLLLVAFNRKMVPIRFVFYNDKADYVYRGPFWRPNG